MMTKEEFIQLSTSFLPSSDLKRFASNVFELFDEDKDGFLDFGEFALASAKQVHLILVLGNYYVARDLFKEPRMLNKHSAP